MTVDRAHRVIESFFGLAIKNPTAIVNGALASLPSIQGRKTDSLHRRTWHALQELPIQHQLIIHANWDSRYRALKGITRHETIYDERWTAIARLKKIIGDDIGITATHPTVMARAENREIIKAMLSMPEKKLKLARLESRVKLQAALEDFCTLWNASLEAGR